jgi:hypothetical protein
MAIFAVLDRAEGESVIFNILHADTLETAQVVSGKRCIEVTGDNVGTHWYYDGEKFVDPTITEGKSDATV